MLLENWIAKSGTTRSELAALLKVSPGAVTRWCDGERIPQREHMREIIKVTKGKVRPADFYK